MPSAFADNHCVDAEVDGSVDFVADDVDGPARDEVDESAPADPSAGSAEPTSVAAPTAYPIPSATANPLVRADTVGRPPTVRVAPIVGRRCPPIQRFTARHNSSLPASKNETV
jgi:hypothetical protein